MNTKTTPLDKSSLLGSNKAAPDPSEFLMVGDRALTRKEVQLIKDKSPKMLMDAGLSPKEVDAFLKPKAPKLPALEEKKEVGKMQAPGAHLGAQKSALTHKGSIGGRVNSVFSSLADWSGLEPAELKTATAVLSVTAAIVVGGVIFLTQTKVGNVLVSSNNTAEDVKIKPKKIRTEESEVVEKKVVPEKNVSKESDLESDLESHSTKASITQTTIASPVQDDAEKIQEKPAVVRMGPNRADINAQAFMKNPEALLSEIRDYNTQQQGKLRESKN